jgi:hypothetical protein
MLLCKKRCCFAKDDAATSVDVVDLDFERSAVKILACRRIVFGVSVMIVALLPLRVLLTAQHLGVAVTVFVVFRESRSDERYLKFTDPIAVCSLEKEYVL